MQDRPTLSELLAATAAHLRENVLPRLEGGDAYHLRIAINLLSVIEREIAEGPAMLRAEAKGLSSLGVTDPPADPENDERGLRESVQSANHRLAEAIRNGEFDDGEAAKPLVAHLHAVVDDKLQIANPRFLERVRVE